MSTWINSPHCLIVSVGRQGLSTARVSGNTVAVLPACQGQGIGRELMHRLTSGRQGIQFVLHARPAVKEFYLKCGFEHAEDMLRIPRRF